MERRAFQAGAVDYIHKPFLPEALSVRVKNAVFLKQMKENLDEAVRSKVDEVLSRRDKLEAASDMGERDHLTGVLSKAAAQDAIGNLCAKDKGILMLMDLDGFKLVNDLYGRNMGDKILAGFSEIIQRAVRSSDLVGRMGADQFVAFCRNIKDEKVIQKKRQR